MFVCVCVIFITGASEVILLLVKANASLYASLDMPAWNQKTAQVLGTHSMGGLSQIFAFRCPEPKAVALKPMWNDFLNSAAMVRPKYMTSDFYEFFCIIQDHCILFVVL